MAKIENYEVFGLASSIYRSGYSYSKTPPSSEDFKKSVAEIQRCVDNGDFSNRHIARALTLSNTAGGGHDQFLTGITVNFDLTLSNKAWVEAERYRFLNFISSMSTIHKIQAMDTRSACNDMVDPVVAERLSALKDQYLAVSSEDKDKKRRAWLTLLYNIPSGFEIMAGMTTNYRCLKNIYSQRKSHPLPDWKPVCDWIETLPLSELITGKR